MVSDYFIVGALVAPIYVLEAAYDSYVSAEALAIGLRPVEALI
jgi:hypothetical protein